MPRDRFVTIMCYLHLVDSSLQKKTGEVGYDHLFKVRSLLDHLAAVFPRYYQPVREVSINEMMIGTRCRISFLQYMPQKPCKFGVKVWVLAEVKAGYMFLAFKSVLVQHHLVMRIQLRVLLIDLVEPYPGQEAPIVCG